MFDSQSPLYNVHCTQLYTVHNHTPYTTVHCTQLYTVHNYTLYTTVHIGPFFLAKMMSGLVISKYGQYYSFFKKLTNICQNML